MDTQFFPVLAHFVHGNIWTGSDSSLRYRLVPDPKEGQMTVQIWPGPMAYQEETVTETVVYPLTEEGMAQMKGWLALQGQNLKKSQ